MAHYIGETMSTVEKQAPVPTVINLRLLDHTLDGSVDVINLSFLFDLRNVSSDWSAAGKHENTKLDKSSKGWRVR